ncbi:MAG: aminodeoxychorismate synthase component I, partial [Leptolyngbyaceae bacterium]|nr:aminodeoxychorismate synthase component I [Leptolyngbyaceae bacterium]
MQPNSVVLYDAQNQHWLHFHSPVEVLTAYSPLEVTPLLETVQQQVDQQGYYAAGFMSYEASPAFDPSFQVQPSQVQAGTDFPLAWFGLFTQPQVITLPDPPPETSMPLLWTPSLSRSRYREAIEQIKNHISQGNTYQVNFSFRLRSPFSGDPWCYFLQLIQAQKSLYGAFINLEDWAICCASPELFFQWCDTTLISRPMKGTAPRGLDYRGDRYLAEALQHSEKNQAENLMIVDMIRNDMGRIAQIGTVQVPYLFEVEQYPTVWQMTSPVQCRTDANWVEIVQALFPCASITGAPKSRTMQIIADLEDSPRRIYTGTIGFLTPDRSAQFNVAIRTVLINKTQQEAEYGVGGGIVWDSAETDEFEECCTKAKILTQHQPSFELLESLLWTPEAGYFLLDLHLQRLQTSASYFAFAVNWDEVQTQLRAIASTLPSASHKIRLRISKSGKIQLSAEYLSPCDRSRPLRVGIAKESIEASNVFLYHKTTHRAIYEQAKQAYSEFDDVLLWNERGELTESCIANLIVEQDGQWYTPPVQCGLLAGTMRAWLLQQGRVEERVLRLEDLHNSSRIFLVNSVRKIQAAIVS